MSVQGAPLVPTKWAMRVHAKLVLGKSSLPAKTRLPLMTALSVSRRWAINMVYYMYDMICLRSLCNESYEINIPYTLTQLNKETKQT